MYEGDLDSRWGNIISGGELTHRFWRDVIAGCYVTHGETFLDHAGSQSKLTGIEAQPTGAS